MIKIDNIEFPKISLGTSPFLGAGQFDSRALNYYSNLYNKPENMINIILKSLEMGINAVNVIAYRKIVDAVLKVSQISTQRIYSSLVIGIEDWEEELRYAEELNSDIIYIHARISDSRRLSLIKEIIESIRRYDFIPGCATHNPATTIPFLDDSKLDISTYLAPINKIGRFMGKDSKSTLDIICNTPKIVIAKKALAAGRLDPLEALQYLTSQNKISGVALGIASVEEAQETLSIAKRLYT
ncbi:MAG: hypothetical protein SVZ03_11065 [Spirochaetota bacterium]|nr:hypothetical protein [Spirochaetota bacterium]